MSNEKFSQLPTVVAATLADTICAVQAGVSVQETLQQVFNISLQNTILSFAGNPNTHVAGSTYQLCWDRTNNLLYVCTTTGNAASAVWTVSTSGALIGPSQGGTGVANPTAHTLPVAEGSSNFAFLGPLTDGQLLIGSTGNNPVPATINAGSGISVANGPGGITISGTGSGMGWNEVTTTSQAMVAETGYVTNNASLVTLTLPTTAAFGSALSIIGKGAGGWTITFGSGQTVQLGAATATPTTGSLSSTNRFDSINLICTTANTVWTTQGAPEGNITYV